MSKPVIITCDSTCDLSPDLLERFQIKTLPLTIQLGDDVYLDGQGFTPDVMYERYRTEGILPKTAAPSIQQFMDFFAQFTSQGYEIVHLDISSELSCTFANARLASQETEGVYPVDSRHLSSGVALLAIEAADCRDKGMSAADIQAHITELIPKVETSFVLDTLEFMSKGGRCSSVTALAANLLKLKPAIEIKDGKLEVYKKYRGSISNVYKQYIKERLSGKSIRPGHVFLTNSGEVDAAVLSELEALIRELIPVVEVHYALAGCTISSHCGPKTLGVLFINE